LILVVVEAVLSVSFALGASGSGVLLYCHIVGSVVTGFVAIATMMTVVVDVRKLQDDRKTLKGIMDLEAIHEERVSDAANLLEDLEDHPEAEA